MSTSVTKETRSEIIERVDIDGKYMEFWWRDQEPKPDGQWHDCSKSYMFWEAYEKAYPGDFSSLNVGLRGVIVEWYKRYYSEVGFNWEISRVLGRAPTT